jgi:maleate isomerase
MARPGMSKAKSRGPGGVGTGACEIGLIALATDHAVEAELRRFLSHPAAHVYTTRVPSPDRYGVASLRDTEAELERASALLVPGSPLDVVAYGCTSATILIGEDRVFARIRRARPAIACTTPITAAEAALKALGARRVALLTPYPAPVHEAVARDLVRRGFGLVDQAWLGVETDSAITQVSAARLRTAVLALERRGADALFISCTSLLTADHVAKLEAALRRPVVTSNQALGWHCQKLAGLAPVGKGLGRLFRL